VSALPRRRSLRHRLLLLSAALLAVSLLAVGCASEPPAAGPDLPADLGAPVASPVVEVDDNVFVPAEIVVEAGTEVRWKWVGRAAHDVEGEGFESDIQVEGTFSHTFDTVGTHPYLCTLHPGMDGTVYVVPSD
jgi:plastocyanin